MRWRAAIGMSALSACTTFTGAEDSGDEGTTNATASSGVSSTSGVDGTTVADSATGTSGTSSPTATTDPTASTTDESTTDESTTDESTTDESTSSSSSSNSDDGSSSSTGDVVACETMPAWWNDDWARRRPISIETSTVSVEQTMVPIRIRLDDQRIDYGAVEDDGVDLRFVADDQLTELSYEVERWDETGDSEVWLNIPVVPADPMPLQVWMYYGNALATPGEDPSAVWSDGFVSVHHFADLKDSTGDGHTGIGPNLPTDAEGQIGRAFFFDGEDDQIELAGEMDYDLTTALTVEAWISVDTFTDQWQAIVTKGDDTWRMHRHSNSNFVGFGSDTDTSSNDNLAGSTPVENGDWFYTAIVYGSDTKRIYVDGDEDVSEGYPGPLRETDAPVWVGNNAEAGSRFFHGRIDEVRISSVERSPEWMELQDRSMRDGLISVGAEDVCR